MARTDRSVREVRIVSELGRGDPADPGIGVLAQDDARLFRFRVDRVIVDSADLAVAAAVAEFVGGELEQGALSIVSQQGAIRTLERDVVPRCHSVLLTDALWDPDEMAELLKAEDFRDLSFGSIEAAATLLAVLRAQAAGLPAFLDAIASEDSTPPNVYLDSLDDVLQRGYGNGPNQPNVTRARQYLALTGAPGVRVGVIDRGFRLANWCTLAPGPGVSAPELPPYHFLNNGGLFGSLGPGPKGYHGHSCLHVFAATGGNATAASGTGSGAISEVQLVEAYSVFNFVDALDALRVLGCRVITTSISWNYPGAFLARIALPSALFDSFEAANREGVITLASAGNDGESIPEAFRVPSTRCEGVIAVGALVADTVQRKSDSNYGPAVGIWAPEGSDVPNIDDAPGPALGSGPALRQFGGTSAATPFAAGIVAILVAADPTLDKKRVLELLVASAWQTADPKVKAAINAYGALETLLGGELPTDDVGTATHPRVIPLVVTGNSAQGSLPGMRIDKATPHRLAVDLPWDVNRVVIDLTAPWRLNGMVFTATMQGATTNLSESWTGSTWAAERLLPAGRLTIDVAAKGPTGYDLSIRADHAVIPADLFEPDDIVELAHVIDASWPTERQMTISPSGDVDWFEERVSRQPDDFFRLEFISTDSELVAELFDVQHRPIGTRTGMTIDASGANFIRLSSGAQTRYLVRWLLIDGEVFQKLQLVPIGGKLPTWIDFSNPRPIEFGGGEESYLIDLNALPPGVRRLEVIGGEGATIRVSQPGPARRTRTTVGATLADLRNFEPGPVLVKVSARAAGRIEIRLG